MLDSDSLGRMDEVVQPDHLRQCFAADDGQNSAVKIRN